MRNAYSGRAAAFEKKGLYEEALADHRMAVLYCAIEAEILNELHSPNLAQALAGSARTYRARGRCLELSGRLHEADVDQKKADQLEADAKKQEAPSAPGRDAAAASIKVINRWTQPVTLVIAGSSHRLEVGEQKMIAVPAGTVPYELYVGARHSAGTVEGGKTYALVAPS